LDLAIDDGICVIGTRSHAYIYDTRGLGRAFARIDYRGMKSSKVAIDDGKIVVDTHVYDTTGTELNDYSSKEVPKCNDVDIDDGVIVCASDGSTSVLALVN